MEELTPDQTQELTAAAEKAKDCQLPGCSVKFGRMYGTPNLIGFTRMCINVNGLESKYFAVYCFKRPVITYRYSRCWKLG